MHIKQLIDFAIGRRRHVHVTDLDH